MEQPTCAKGSDIRIPIKNNNISEDKLISEGYSFWKIIANQKYGYNNNIIRNLINKYSAYRGSIEFSLELNKSIEKDLLDYINNMGLIILFEEDDYEY